MKKITVKRKGEYLLLELGGVTSAELFTISGDLTEEETGRLASFCGFKRSGGGYFKGRAVETIGVPTSMVKLGATPKKAN